MGLLTQVSFRFSDLILFTKFGQQDLRQVYQNRLERHLTVFCIDPTVVYYVHTSIPPSVIQVKVWIFKKIFL